MKKAYKNYVCPDCFRPLNKCRCGRNYISTHLIFIDYNIQEHIQLLNDKGYKTTGCCEGHYQDTCNNTYVAFGRYQQIQDKGLPENFKLRKNGNIIYRDLCQRDQEQFEKEKAEALTALKIWIENLPEING